MDTYDVSGDEVRFIGTVYNRPDLLPIARAIQYAQAHDQPAVRAYCASDDVAQRLIRDMPPFVFGDVLSVKLTGETRESVELGDYRLEVEKIGDRWLVSSFRHD